MDAGYLRCLSVLLIEDDPDIKEIMILALGLDARIDVATAQTGASALSTLKHTPRYDVILLDSQLPDATGVTLAREIRRNHGIPIIFITAAVGSADRASYHEAGAIGIIAKPFNPLTLAKTVRELLGLTA